MLPICSGLLFMLVSCAGPAASDDTPRLRQGPFQSEEAGRKQLEDYAATFDNAQQWVSSAS